MSAPLTPTQLPMDSILDINGRQTYLGNSFILPNAGTSLSTTNETPLCLIKNPAGSGKSIFLSSRRMLSSNIAVLFQFYLNPTVNVLGSATGALNMRSGATTASISLCYLGMTITSNGTLLSALAAGTTTVVMDALYILDPGANLLVTGKQLSAGTSTAISGNVWYEI